MKGAPVFVVVDAFSDEAFIHQTGRVARRPNRVWNPKPLMIRMFVHVNKDPLFLSHASLETSLSPPGALDTADNDSSGPFQFMNWVEKKKKRNGVCVFHRITIF